MIKLSVNLNAVAMLRNRRNVGWPNVTNIAKIVLEAGADGITVHPRPDERHIRRGDVFELKELLKNFPDKEYNIEGYPSEDFLSLIEEIKPHQVTFVPDAPDQSTSDHGWEINENKDLLKSAILRAKKHKIRTSLFIDEGPSVPPKALLVGADRVELYTGPYGANFITPEGDYHLQRLSVTARAAKAAGLKINAGHDLTLENLPALVEQIPFISEVSIGHGITSDALILGFERAVKQYRAVLSQ